MRAFLIGLLAVLLLPLALAAPTRAETSIFDVRSQLVQLLLSQISTPGSFEVTVETVESPGDGVTQLLGVKVSDQVGIWAEAAEVSLQWDASRLLSGELDVPLILVRDLTVTRGPAEGAEAPALRESDDPPGAVSPFDWPRAPVAVILREMRLENIVLEAPVLGHAIAFDAVGRAEDQGDIQAAVLAITRRDQVAGTISLEYQRDFAANSIALTLEAEEAAGGLVAALAGLPADSASTLSLTADGPRDDWRLRFAAATENVFTARGTAQVSYVAPLSVTAEFELAPGPRMSPRTRQILAPSARLTAELSEADGLVEVTRFAIEGPALVLDAAGSFRRADSRFDLTLGLEGRAPLAGLVDGVAFDGLRFDGTVEGTPEAFTATGAAELRGLASALLDAGQVALRIEARQEADITRLGFEGRGDALRIDRLGPDLLGEVGLAGRAVLEAGRLTLRDARLRSDPLSAELDGSIATDGLTGAFDLAAKVADLAPVAGAYDLALSGAAEAVARLALTEGRAALDLTAALTGLRSALVDLGNATMSARLVERPEDLRLTATVEGTGIRVDRLTPAVLGPARIALDAALAGDAVTLAQARLESAALVADLRGTLDLASLSGRLGYRAASPAVAPVAAAYEVDMAGSIEAEGTVTLDAGTPQIDGRLTATDAEAFSRRFGRLDLRHALRLGEEISGSLSLAGRDGALGPVRLQTDLRYAAPQLALSGLSGQVLALDLSGDLTADIEAPLAEGTLRLAGPLAPLGRFLDQPMNGTLDGVLDGVLALTTQDARQDVALTLEVNQIEAAGVLASEARLEAAASDVTGTPALRLSLSAREALAGPASLDEFSITAQGPLTALDVTANSSGWIDANALAVAVAARLDLADGLQATISTLDAALGDVPVRLQAPLALRETGGGVALGGIDLAISTAGRLAGDVTILPSGLFGALRGTTLDFALIDRVLGAGISSGTLTFETRFDTRPGRASAELQAEAANVAFSDLAGLTTSISGNLQAAWDGRQALADLRLEVGDGAPLTAQLTLPLRPGRPLPTIPQAGPLSGAVAWSGDLAQLWVLLPGGGQELSGPGRIDLRLAGTVARPEISGEVVVEGGRFEEATAGTILTELNVTSRIENSRVLVLELTALDGADGEVSAQARLAVVDGRARIDGQVTAREAVLVRRDDLTARVSADLTLAGPLTALALSGGIVIDRAELRLVDASPATIIDLEPVRIKGDDAPRGGTSPVGRITLDLTVSAPGLVFARGRGLDSEWRVDLTIRGTAQKPRISGLIDELRGSFSLLGQRFDLTRGEVLFTGAAAINPTLDIVLERTANEITGQIVVSGPARDPEVTFTSTPELPEGEVLPRLLFGSSSQGLSGAQAIQLAAGINTLMTGRRGVLDAARDALGVDLLQIDSSDESTTVTVGRSVLPGVFVGAKQDLEEEGESGVTVQIDLFEGVRVEAEAGVTSSIGLTWSRDF